MRKYKAVISTAIVGIVLLALWWRFLRYGGDIREVANRVAIAVTGDSLARHSRSLAGWRAQNCGQVPTSGGNEHVTACATAAFRERRPFRVRFDIQGKDALQLLTFFIIAPLLAIGLAYAAWRGKPRNLPGTKDLRLRSGQAPRLAACRAKGSAKRTAVVAGYLICILAAGNAYHGYNKCRGS